MTIAVSIEYRVWNVEELGNGCIADRKDVLYEMLVRADVNLGQGENTQRYLCCCE